MTCIWSPITVARESLCREHTADAGGAVTGSGCPSAPGSGRGPGPGGAAGSGPGPGPGGEASTGASRAPLPRGRLPGHGRGVTSGVTGERREPGRGREVRGRGLARRGRAPVWRGGAELWGGGAWPWGGAVELWGDRHRHRHRDSDRHRAALGNRGSLPSQPAAAARSPPHWDPSRCPHCMPRSVLPFAPQPRPVPLPPRTARELRLRALGHRAGLSWVSFTEQVRAVAEIGPRFSLWRINLALRLLLREVVVACVGDVQTDCCSYPIKISGSIWQHKGMSSVADVRVRWMVTQFLGDGKVCRGSVWNRTASPGPRPHLGKIANLCPRGWTSVVSVPQSSNKYVVHKSETRTAASKTPNNPNQTIN